jgi:hypothetical protein
MSQTTPQGTIPPIDDDEADAFIESADPDVRTLSSTSEEVRDIREMIMELTDQVRFFGTRILALEERAIIGGTVIVPSPDLVDDAIPEFTSSTVPNPTRATTFTSHHPEHIPSGTLLTFSELIGEFLPSERTIIDLELNAMQVISKDERIKLGPSDKSKLFFTFSKGVPNKFKAINTIIGQDNASTITNISSFTEQRLELQKHITGIAAHPVFLILKFDLTGNLLNPDTPEGTPSNILSSNVLPSLEEVEKSTFYHYKRGSKYNQENLIWTYEAVRNSCDRDLQTILDAKMLKYNSSERFGPIYYYQLVYHMTTVDPKAIRAITQELTNLKVTEQEGESIARICKLIRSTIIWLDIVDMMPPDLYAIVYDILETCTVPDFRLFLKTLTTNASLNGMNLTVEELLGKSEEQYRLLILSRKWNSSEPTASSFQVQRNPRVVPDRDNRRSRETPDWIKIPPTQEEPHERTYQNNAYKWCATCKRWFYGNRAHLTAEHVQGFRNPQSPATLPSGNVATLSATQNESSPYEPNAQVSFENTITRTYFRDGL